MLLLPWKTRLPIWHGQIFTAIRFSPFSAFSICTASARKYSKNFAYLSAVLLLIISINLNLNFAKTHFFGFSAENKLLERLTARIQSHQDFSRTSQYTVIQAGEIPLPVPVTHLPSANEKYGYYMLQAPYTRHWIAFEYYNFYAPYDYVREGTAIRPEEITPQMADFLTKRVKTWPSADSVYVDKTTLSLPHPTRQELLTRQFELLSRQLPVSASPDANRKFSSQSSETQIPSQTPRHNPEAPRQTVNGNMP